MNKLQTGIAVAVALIVVVFFFVFGGTSLFDTSAPTDAAAGTVPTGTTNQLTPGTEAVSTGPTTMTTENVTQLQITDEVIGTGETAAAGDLVTVDYVGSLTSGQVFDASANRGTAGFTFPLGQGQVIKGWDQGVVGMKVGGKRRLVIPADLAYGSQSVGNVIPANSTLIFEIELLKVRKP